MSVRKIASLTRTNGDQWVPPIAKTRVSGYHLAASQCPTLFHPCGLRWPAHGFTSAPKVHTGRV